MTAPWVQFEPVSLTEQDRAAGEEEERVATKAEAG